MMIDTAKSFQQINKQAYDPDKKLIYCFPLKRPFDHHRVTDLKRVTDIYELRIPKGCDLEGCFSPEVRGVFEDATEARNSDQWYFRAHIALDELVQKIPIINAPGQKYGLTLLAHQNDRKADNHIQYKRFDEALTCHKDAAELLLHAMQLTSVTKAVEALRLQYDYHKRQEDIVQVKKVQFEIKKKIMEYRNRRTMQKKTEKAQKEKKDKDLQWAIFKTMEEADSLLGMLLPKEAPEAEVAAVPGFKRPKDEQTVIEELYTLNTQLRIFITQLLTKLETAERQLEVAKIRLEVYENAPPKIIDLPPLDMSVSESLEASKYEFPAPASKALHPNTGQSED